MGFGFVEYRKPEQAQKALKQLQVRGVSQERSRSRLADGGQGSRPPPDVEWGHR